MELLRDLHALLLKTSDKLCAKNIMLCLLEFLRAFKYVMHLFIFATQADKSALLGPHQSVCTESGIDLVQSMLHHI